MLLLKFSRRHHERCATPRGPLTTGDARAPCPDGDGAASVADTVRDTMRDTVPELMPELVETRALVR